VQSALHVLHARRGPPSLPRDQALSADEIVRLVGIAVRDLGVRQVRFTGGEPLLRRDLVEIIERCAALEPRPELSLTTNAIGLAERAVALARPASTASTCRSTRCTPRRS